MKRIKGSQSDQNEVHESFNETAFLTDVSQSNWDRIVGRPIDLNVLVDDWSNLFSMIIDKHAPITPMRVSEKHFHGSTRILRGP